MRRLNRNEYENTLRDLLGVHVAVKDLLPEDGLAAGFDTVSEGLAVSPTHLVRYQRAIDKALDASLMSAPITEFPILAKWTAKGKPIFPSPITQIFIA